MNKQQRINGVWLAADTITGVYKVDPVDFPEMGMSSQSEFYESLPSLSEGEIIFSYFDGNHEDIFEKIDAEYGIY